MSAGTVGEDSRRFKAALAAMHALLASGTGIGGSEECIRYISERAVDYADALLGRLEATEGKPGRKRIR
jgi:hypothetical protein